MPKRPKTAEEFIAFMAEIWKCKPGPSYGGGTIIHAQQNYNKFNDAIQMAKQLKMVKTGGTRVNTEWWRVYRFPYELDNSVLINPQGSAIKPGHNRYGPRKSLTHAPDWRILTSEYRSPTERAIEKLQELQRSGDTEAAHCDADQILCDLLIEMGHKAVVYEYHKIEKWSA